MKIYDAVVIGAGPAGLTAALYLVRSGVSTAIIEKSSAGGQVLSTSEIENYPGFPKGIKGWELADLFSAHIDDYPVERLRGDVTGLETASEPGGLHHILLDEGKEPIGARSIIVAAGATHRRLGASSEDRLSGKGVSYCAVCDGNFYRDQIVAVVGGGNSALEEALYLSRIVSKVYLIHRRDGFRGSKHYLDRIRSMPDKIELVTSHVVEDLIGENELENVVVRNVHNNALRSIPVKGLFVYVGMEANGSFLPASIDLNSQGFIYTDAEMNTSIPGIFAAGDIRAKHCRQISSAVGDGATAATAALTYLEQPDA